MCQAEFQIFRGRVLLRRNIIHTNLPLIEDPHVKQRATFLIEQIDRIAHIGKPDVSHCEIIRHLTNRADAFINRYLV